MLRGNPGLSRKFWSESETDLSIEFITALIAQTNVDSVQAVFSTAPSPQSNTVCAAVAAFCEKRSMRGLALMENVAIKHNMLSGGPESAPLWFAFIRAYGTLERLDYVRSTFKAAREAGAWCSLTSSSKYTNIFLNALHTDVHLVFVRARQLLDEGALPDPITFNILLKACMRAKDPKRASVALKWMRDAGGIQPDDVTWASIIKVRSYAGDFQGVLATRDMMTAAGFEPTPSIWGCLLVACGAAQQHETALMLWREAKAALGGAAAVPPNLFNAMLTSCNACGQGERTLDLLEEMKAVNRPNAKSYNLAIKACEGRPGQRLRLEQLSIALKLYEEMRSAGISPDLVTYGTLIELCAEGRQGALAWRLRERMIAADVKPNVVVMTSLLKALARAGRIDDCLEAFSSMVWGPARMRPNRVTFKTLVRELRQAGALGAALRAYEGMRRAHHAPINVEFQELIAAAAEAALAEGDPELQAQVASLCNIGSTLDVIDLHGMSTLEARAAVLCVLSMLMTEYHETGSPPSSLTIITGKGKHSRDGQAVLPGIVLRLLSEELYIPVDMGANTHNNSDSDGDELSGGGDDGRSGGGGGTMTSGRIYIDQSQLLRWLRARVGTRQQHQRHVKKAAVDDI